MMTLPRLLLQGVYLAGRPWTVWVVAIGTVALARALGAGGFDAVTVAIGPAFLWAGVSWVCRVITRYTGDPFARSILPANRPMPKPQLAVIVAPDQATEACPAPPRMAEQLSEPLRHLVTPAGG